MNNIAEINSKLPKNYCVQIHEFSDFPVLIEKLSDLWSGIIIPQQDPEDTMKWAFSYFEYTLNNKKCYLIWFFVNEEMSDEEILKEVKVFLENVQKC